MKTNIATILNELAHLIEGDPAPSFKSTETTDLVSAMASLEFPTDHARVGAAVVEMLLGRLKATAIAERELALINDGSHFI
jgi:hypothetical protein